MESNSPNPAIIMRPCRTCGKYMELPADSMQVYCSPECAAAYRQCVVCGRWFLVQEGSDEYCSEECRTPVQPNGIIFDYSDEVLK